jgi:hypothetical protein
MASAAPKHEQVTVTLGATNEDDGTIQNVQVMIPGGPTRVPDLKAELQIAGASALWVVEKNGRKKALADHQTHNVKEGDHYEALVKGGIS